MSRRLQPFLAAAAFVAFGLAVSRPAAGQG
jgi:hypothetical protein